MSAVLEAPIRPAQATLAAVPEFSFRSLADLVDSLGGIPLERIRATPMVGTATEEDLLKERGCELIDGVLVEKAMGFFEGRLALILAVLIENWLTNNNIGFVNGEGAYTRLRTGLVRIPDLSFYRWDRVGAGGVPKDAICELCPNLAVEVISRTNTKAEIERKRDEYFEAGADTVWIVDPVRQIVEVWRTARDCHLVGISDSLDGGTVLPGFVLSVREWFERASPTPPQP